MSTDHTGPGPLEGLIPPELMLTMSGGEPAVVGWRVEELDAALVAAHDMGLPVALAPRTSWRSCSTRVGRERGGSGWLGRLKPPARSSEQQNREPAPTRPQKKRERRPRAGVARHDI